MGRGWVEMTASLPVPCSRHTRTLEHEPNRVYRPIVSYRNREGERTRKWEKVQDFWHAYGSIGRVCAPLTLLQKHLNSPTTKRKKRDESLNCSTCWRRFRWDLPVTAGNARWWRLGFCFPNYLWFRECPRGRYSMRKLVYRGIYRERNNRIKIRLGDCAH